MFATTSRIRVAAIWHSVDHAKQQSSTCINTHRQQGTGQVATRTSAEGTDPALHKIMFCTRQIP
jgi:hypothetical protein